MAWSISTFTCPSACPRLKALSLPRTIRLLIPELINLASLPLDDITAPQSQLANPVPAESSDSEDQFTDAQSNPMSPTIASPIPKTRVERVDDQPAHGEVPGTEAYKIREGDAAPDEIAIIPEQDSAAAPTAHTADIPTTVVEEAPGDIPGGHTAEFERKREADAQPDQLIGAGGEEQAGNDDVSSGMHVAKS